MSEISQSGNRSYSGPEDLKNPDYMPPLAKAVPLGLQHVLAMFAGNVTVPIIIAGAAGIAGGDKIFLIQMAMLVAGLATLLQTIGMGPIGARLPIMQGTSFAFLPVIIPIAASIKGVAALPVIFGATLVGGIFHFFLGTVIGRFRGILPPLVTGLVVATIGLTLLPTGVEYVGGGKLAKFVTKDFGAWYHVFLGSLVIVVILGTKFLAKGIASASAILIGLIVGYLVAIPMDVVNFGTVADAAWFAFPQPLKYGISFEAAAVVGMCLMAIVSAIETVGDISGITKGGAGREATNREISGGTMADGLGTALGGLMGAMPNTSYSQNVGIISLTGVMSRHVVTIGALFLILSAFVPKIGAVVSAMPNAVLGGAAVVMFGMIAGAGLKLLNSVDMNRRNMVIIAVSLSVGLGLKAEPGVVSIFPDWVAMMMTTGLFPVAFLSILLNLLLPKEDH
ncbi:uracil-xanthine permease family protein [Sneathiella chinensis]|uniref:Xanthine/uracil permease n=1 Tax=Sneathiella chinensis TaxID=349750 RepID=A0ABQ5U366_9PROT|nr:nucleobase:cation symporter-2 family protein [Sneathiella chinensis]GLQ06151.1 xanthine/uracil permease [Sneathiella chinensis]